MRTTSFVSVPRSVRSFVSSVVSIAVLCQHFLACLFFKILPRYRTDRGIIFMPTRVTTSS